MKYSKRQIVAAPIAVEIADGPTHEMMRLVEQNSDIKAGDLMRRSTQHLAPGVRCPN
ncbi:MAG: hypothetical protein ACRDTC_09130 [Pseudonocardiaceae bacterium]